MSVAPGPVTSAPAPDGSGAAPGHGAPGKSLWSRWGAWLGFRERRRELAGGVAPGPNLPEELAKLQRGLRRLSLANEQHGELMQGIAARLQDLDQNVMRLALRSARDITLDEDTVLRCLDGLEKSRTLPGLPEAARLSLRALHDSLCSAAGWRAVATLGAAPEGVHLRVTEVLAYPGAASFVIYHILEQGYIRPDGSPVRPAVVVAAGPKQDAGGASPAPDAARADPPIAPSTGGDPT